MASSRSKALRDFCSALTVPFADQVFRHAVADDWDKVDKPLSALVSLEKAVNGGPLGLAMLYWVDSLKAHMLGGWYPHTRLRMGPGSKYKRIAGGETYVLGSAEADMAMTPQELWAASMIDARLAGDEDRWDETWKQAPDGEFGQYVWMLLTMVAASVRATEIGYARKDIFD